MAKNAGSAGADVNGNPVVAHSGVHNGWLYTGNGWAAEEIAVPIDSWANRSNCSASIYAHPSATAPESASRSRDCGPTPLRPRGIQPGPLAQHTPHRVCHATDSYWHLVPE